MSPPWPTAGTATTASRAARLLLVPVSALLVVDPLVLGVDAARRPVGAVRGSGGQRV